MIRGGAQLDSRRLDLDWDLDWKAQLEPLSTFFTEMIVHRVIRAYALVYYNFTREDTTKDKTYPLHHILPNPYITEFPV